MFVFPIFFILIFFGILYLLFFHKPNIQVEDSSTPKYQQRQKIQQPVVYPQLTAVLVAVIVISQQILMFNIEPGLGWGVFAAIIGICLAATLDKAKRTPLLLSMGALSVVTGLMVTFRANGFVQSINAIFLSVVLFLLLFFKAYQKVNWQGVWLIKYALVLIPESIKHLFRVFEDSAERGKSGTKGINITNIIKTVVITLVVLVVFVSLLMNADPVFANLIREVWDTAFIRVIIGLLFAIAAVTFFTISLKTPKDEKFTFSFFSFWDVFIPVTAVGVLFGLFLGIQYRYLFGSHDLLKVFELTYSEYVRKGFIELMWASLFASILSYLVYLKNQVLSDEKQRQALKIVNVIFGAELLLLVASAFQRNVLYIETFGLTRVRIVGNFFLAWVVAVAALTLIMVIFKQVTERHFLVGVWATSVLVMLSLNVVNIDRMVFAESPSLENEVRDYFYLANLSEDVAEEWLLVVSDMEQELSQIKTDADQFYLSNEDGTNLRTGDTIPDSPYRWQYFESDVERIANIKLAAYSLKDHYERLDKKYGSLDHVKETYYPDLDLPKRLIRDRRLASMKIGEQRGYAVLAAESESFLSDLDEIIARADRLAENVEKDFYYAQQTLLNDYRRPFVSVRAGYRPSYVSEPTGSPLPAFRQALDQE